MRSLVRVENRVSDKDKPKLRFVENFTDQRIVAHAPHKPALNVAQKLKPCNTRESHGEQAKLSAGSFEPKRAKLSKMLKPKMLDLSHDKRNGFQKQVKFSTVGFHHEAANG